jgi:DNA-binding NarL/FixJ family response regulator
MNERVLIVDDHPLTRSALASLLRGNGFDVVGEAADGASALELALQLDPQVVLLDVALPDRSGFDVATQLAGDRPKVILTSSRRQSDFGGRVARSGALGFVPKDQLSGDALHALLGEDA